MIQTDITELNALMYTAAYVTIERLGMIKYPTKKAKTRTILEKKNSKQHKKMEKRCEQSSRSQKRQTNTQLE